MSGFNSLNHLPHEILLNISNYISQSSDLLHFLCANRTLHDILFLELCKRDIANTGGQAIVSYAANGYENGVRLMLAAGADVNLKGSNSPHLTPLGEAAYNHRVGIAKLLLDHGADMHDTDEKHNSALLQSTREIPPQGDTSIFELLLDYKADVNGIGYMGTPLSMATHHGDVKMMKFFLDKGADPNIVYGYRNGAKPISIHHRSKRTVLHDTAERNMPFEAMEILLNAGAQVNVQERGGFSPLHLVVLASGQVSIDKAKVEALVRFGANVNIQRAYNHFQGRCHGICGSTHSMNFDPSIPAFGDTPLHWAARNDCDNGTEIMTFLLENGARVNARGRQGCTPLHVAKAVKIKGKEHERLEILLRHGADINARDGAGRSVFHYQARRLSSELFKWLCDIGCDVNVENDVRATPIFEALETVHDGHSIVYGHSEVLLRRKLTAAETLISLGANVNQISSEGKSPLGLAVRQRCEDLTHLLLKHGADVHHRDSDGKTPLQWVLRIINADEIKNGLDPSHIEFDRQGLAELLLSYGGDLNDVAPVERTPGGRRLWDLNMIIQFVEEKTDEETRSHNPYRTGFY